MISSNHEHFSINVKKILGSRFDNNQKRNIIPFGDRLNFACPYCGDSMNDNTKKRGNLYKNSYMYVCFNCDKKCSYEKLCRDYNIHLDADLRMEIIKHLEENISFKDYDTFTQEADKSSLISLIDIQKALDDNNDAPISNLIPIRYNSIAYNYLINRGISPNLHKDIYEAKYWSNEKNYEPVIAFMNRRDDMVLGIQIRNLKEGYKRLFKVYNYETVKSWLLNDNITEMNEMVILNKISYFYNILNINIHNKITIFEGYQDSLFYPNSIGTVGVGTDTRFFDDNNLEKQFFYDNDYTGFKKSIEKLRLGEKVFLWKKLTEYLTKKFKPSDAYYFEHKLSNIKDLNKLSQLKANPYKEFELDKQFSRDELDIYYLPLKKPINKNGNNFNKNETTPNRFIKNIK